MIGIKGPGPELPHRFIVSLVCSGKELFIPIFPSPRYNEKDTSRLTRRSFMIWYVIQASAGFLAGVAAGAVMGIASDIACRARFFRSSLFVIDGNFFMRSIQVKGTATQVYLAGVPIHLVTSGVFGAIYTLGTSLFDLPALSILPASLYVFFLWLSMLFIALPTSGQGILGRKAGASTWLEQLILHVLFLAAYYGALHLAHRISIVFIQTIE